MRLSPALFLFPSLIAAQGQVPFIEQVKETYEAVSAKLFSLLNSATSPPSTRDGAARAASQSVIPLTAGNWQSFLRHSGTPREYNPPETWMVYITGQNKTCGPGFCEKVDRAWNESVALFSHDTSAPHLGKVDCDEQELLCGAWFVSVPSIWVIMLPHPRPDQSPAPTNIYEFPLNKTTTTLNDITRIHTRKEYVAMKPAEGAWHPFDGVIARLGLTMPMAYVLFYLSKVPSWAFLVFISFFSRTFMARRMTAPRGPAGQRPHQD